jgi:hypothetical protein
VPRRTIGSLSDPAVRRERARLGGLARTSTDYYVSKVVERAGELSDEQAEELRRLLPRPKPPYVEMPPEVGES